MTSAVFLPRKSNLNLNELVAVITTSQEIQAKQDMLNNTMEIQTIGKYSDAGRDWGQEEKGMTEDEMAGWHHQLDEREFE